MTPPPLTLICDFDGTITLSDVGAALCERFAPGVLERVDARWHRGEIGFAEAFRLACLELKASREALVAHALEVAVARPGFALLVAECEKLGVECVVASAGLDLYVEPILERELGNLRRHVEVRTNVARVTSLGVEVDFPHAHPDCDACGSCKGLRARAARADGRCVIGVGDSFTDRCLVRESQHVFARGWLADHCRDEGVVHETYDDFEPVVDLLRRLAAP